MFKYFTGQCFEKALKVPLTTVVPCVTWPGSTFFIFYFMCFISHLQTVRVDKMGQQQNIMTHNESHQNIMVLKTSCFMWYCLYRYCFHQSTLPASLTLVICSLVMFLYILFIPLPLCLSIFLVWLFATYCLSSVTVAYGALLNIPTITTVGLHPITRLNTNTQAATTSGIDLPNIGCKLEKQIDSHAATYSPLHTHTHTADSHMSLELRCNVQEDTCSGCASPMS